MNQNILKPKPIQCSLAVMPTFMRDATRFFTSEIVGGQFVPSPIPWQVSIQGGVNCAGTILDASYLTSVFGNLFFMDSCLGSLAEN